MSNISWLEYIKLYKRGRNSNNTHFKFTGIKDYTLKKKKVLKEKKKVQGMNVKYKILWLSYIAFNRQF